MTVSDAEWRHVSFKCDRLAAWGVNERDAVLLRAALRSHDTTTHHLVLSVDPCPAVVVLNRR